jgi:hypothetical protein
METIKYLFSSLRWTRSINEGSDWPEGENETFVLSDTEVVDANILSL